MFISLFLILNINLLIMLINEIEKYLSNNEIHSDILFKNTQFQLNVNLFLIEMEF